MRMSYDKKGRNMSHSQQTIAWVTAVRGDELCQNKTRLDSCLVELPQLQSPGIPSDKEAVDTACRAFKSGMRCFDQYVSACFNGNDRVVINANVAGARKAFTRLCDEPDFQREYLEHAACYRNVSKDWETCARRFMEHVTSGTAAQLCCARSAFLECVFAAGTHHCSPAAARFLHQIAEMLSNAHVYRTTCHATSAALCSAGTPLRPDLNYLLLTATILAATALCVQA